MEGAPRTPITRARFNIHVSYGEPLQSQAMECEKNRKFSKIPFKELTGILSKKIQRNTLFIETLRRRVALRKAIVVAWTTGTLSCCTLGLTDSPRQPVPRVNHGEGVHYSSLAIDRWAIQISSFSKGENTDLYTDPLVALGPTSSNPLDVVSLGDGGIITLEMAPFANHPGADLAVWENGILHADGVRIFGELAFVAVSSDGSTFATFPTQADGKPLKNLDGSDNPHGYLNRTYYRGFAGVHPSAIGTAFDLSRLYSTEAVRTGAVDLDSVRFVRITDIVGDGSQQDSRGEPIYDPVGAGVASGYGSTAGFDLSGVASLHPAKGAR